MRILLLTVAGLSSRFSESVGYPCVKCLYYENDFSESLLSRMLERHSNFDEIVIVGGYEYEKLEHIIGKQFSKIRNKITLVKNEAFATYGSGYSLYKGYEVIKDKKFNELIFAEGDLFLDDETFDKICSSKGSVITYNYSPIESNKSVAFYISKDGKPHYIYDTGHKVLEINEPFQAIYNSGQVWKFNNQGLLKKVYEAMLDIELQGTNLIPINKYFQELNVSEYELLGFSKWINCNTVTDFKKSLEG